MSLGWADQVVNGSAVSARGRRLLSFVRTLFRSPAAAFGVSLFLLFALLALIGPAIAPYAENEQILADARQAPSLTHWFGADHLGRDVFSRILLGTRSIFLLAGGGTLVAVLLGTALGLLSGYRGGWFDELLMRLFDSLLALPALLLALLILGTVRASFSEEVSAIGKGAGVLLVLVVVYTPIVARLVRSVVLEVKTRAYIDVARMQGESRSRLLLREILPAVLPTLAVEAALRFSYAIFLAASLGYLGIGVQPPNPDWGLMVNEARQNFFQVPWALYFPAAAISLLIIAVNLMADGLKRAFQGTD